MMITNILIEIFHVPQNIFQNKLNKLENLNAFNASFKHIKP